MPNLSAMLISIISALVGLFVGHSLAIKRKRTDELFEMRMRAYTDFLGATSRLVTARRTGKTQDELEDLALLNDAKNRILISAEKSVVERLVKFWDAGGTLENESEILAFERFCMQIRVSLGLDWKNLHELRVSDTMFKLEPSNFSYRAASRSFVHETEKIAR